MPNITTIEALIMKMLLSNSASEMYGWEMMEASDGKLKRGTIYVILDRMEDKGFIESRKEEKREGQRGLPRRMYKLTGHGQRSIHAWEVGQAAYTEGGGYA